MTVSQATHHQSTSDLYHFPSRCTGNRCVDWSSTLVVAVGLAANTIRIFQASLSGLSPSTFACMSVR